MVFLKKNKIKNEITYRYLVEHSVGNYACSSCLHQIYVMSNFIREYFNVEPKWGQPRSTKLKLWHRTLSVEEPGSWGQRKRFWRRRFNRRTTQVTWNIPQNV